MASRSSVSSPYQPCLSAALPGDGERAQNVRRIAAGGEAHQHVTGHAETFDLPGEDFVKAEIAKWAMVVKQANIKVE